MLTLATAKGFIEFLNNAQRFFRPRFFLDFVAKKCQILIICGRLSPFTLYTFPGAHFSKNSILVKYFLNSTVYHRSLTLKA